MSSRYGGAPPSRASSYGGSSGRAPAPSSSGQQRMPPPPSQPAPGRGPPPSAPPSRVPAPSAGGAAPPLQVSGCTNPTVANIIKGTYVVDTTNHNKPVYKKQTAGATNAVSVLIYFWDERDGPSFSGWWFGPKVGGDQVWAYNGQKTSMLPPGSNWRVPWDGPEDKSLLVMQGGAPRGDARGGAVPPAPGPPPGRGAGAGSYDSRAREADDRRRREDDDRRRREAEDRRKREEQEQRRRKEEENRRAQERAEEERKRAEREAAEQRRRQREREEEDRRREQEKKRRREEEEQKRREGNAAMAVRKVIQKMRAATPENFDKLSKELEETQAANLNAMGSQVEYVSKEVEQALQQAQRQVEATLKKREEDEKRRQEEEKRRKEEQEMVERVMGEATAVVKQADAEVAKAQEQAEAAMGGAKSGDPEEMLEAAGTTEKVVEAATAVVQKAQEALKEKETEMGDNEASRAIWRDYKELQRTLAEGRRSLDKLLQQAKESRGRAKCKAEALAIKAIRKEKFSKYDADQDGKLSRDEIISLCVGEHGGFECPHDALDKILRILEPVTFEKFRSLHQKISIAKSEVKVREERAAEKERQRVLEEQRAEARKASDEISEAMGSAEAVLNNAETESRAFSKDAEMTADKIKETAGAAESACKEAAQAFAAAMEKLKALQETCASNDGLRDFDKKDVPRLKSRHERATYRIEKITSAIASAREKAVHKAYAELDSKKSDAVEALRAKMTADGKTGEQQFDEINGGEPLTQEKFVTFLKGLEKISFEDGEAEKVFDHIIGEKEERTLTKDQFLETTRMYYKCVKQTVLSEEVSIKSKTVKRLELGEVLEALEAPAKEEGAGVMRVKCRSTVDEAVGFVTIAGNQGTTFLQPGGNIFTCVKETSLTDGPVIKDSKTIRQVAKGEKIEAYEFQKKDEKAELQRVRGKAKLDGAKGWITVTGNQGTVYLESC